MRRQVQPILDEIDRLEKEYGFDRPLWQYQPLMITLGDLLNLREATKLYDDEDGS